MSDFIKFTKMQGIGNDYVYIDCTKKEIDNPKELAIKVSNRNFGIGSDGLILICTSKIADFRMRMFNSDGSEAEMCGNGIRCVAKFAFEKGLTNKKNILIETLAGIKKINLNLQDGHVESVTVDMGEPILEAKKIPICKEIMSKSKENIRFYIIKDKIIDKEMKFTCVSMGNPHAITFVDNTANFEILKYGPKCEINNHFPKKVNTEFIQIIDRNYIKMRVWERGTGETLACGTGACAAVVACILNDYTDRNVLVELLGGNLKINWSKEDNHIYMTGPATIVFDGEFYI